jgi:eukaryotic-like serine/threonine-protein kinase
MPRLALAPRGIIEPGAQTQLRPPSGNHGTTSLPDDLLRAQRARTLILNVVGAILWTTTFLLDYSMSLHGDRGPYRSVIEGTAAVLAAAMALYVRFGRSSPAVKANVGLGSMAVHAFALAMLNSWAPQPTTMRPLSGITIMILFFGMMAPASPRKTLLASLVAASMDPLGVWIAHLRGLPVPSVLGTFLMFFPNYSCALLTVVPARILYKLGRNLREAREMGSYHLVERLGEGGMGEVWLAQHRLLARTAAIKLIRPERLGEVGSEDAAMTLGRFAQEAQATAALSSPNTIRLFDFGLTGDGTFFYVMERLDGRDLETLVRTYGPLPPARAVYMLQQICRSLAEAHARGLIHRDVKPANIYVCRMGLEYDFIKVLDFGLVKVEKRADATTMMTAPVALGTPAYMAPEAILGEGEVDRRVDVYALGCVAFYLLTGERVFNAPAHMQLLMQHLQEPPAAPSRRTVQHIPETLDRLVLDCLEKDPGRRPADAAAVFQRLGECPVADWTQEMATTWWETHLPALASTGALSLAMQTVPVGTP